MSVRRTVTVALFIAVVVVPAAFARMTTARQVNIRTLDSNVLAKLNDIRVSHGLVPLRANRQLAAAAEAHSTQMLADGYFAHESADGSPFWKRLTGYSTAAPHGTWSVGENLLWSSPDVDAGRAVQLWMASPEHRENILSARWRDIGIAAVHAEAAPGTYGGQAATVITTDFGFRG